MPEQLVLRTDRITLFAYTLLTLVYALFFALVVQKSGGFSVKSLILILLVLPVVAYFVFLSRKRVVISDEGIGIFGLTGRKWFSWDKIEEVSLSPGRRYFLFIATSDGELAIIDDTTERFEELLREILKRVDGSKLQENFENIASSYRKSYGSIILVYAASLILLAVILSSYI